jgi:hypothetical protein
MYPGKSVDRQVLLESRRYRDSRRRVKDAELDETLTKLSLDEATVIHDYTIGGRYINDQLWSGTADDFVWSYERFLKYSR